MYVAKMLTYAHITISLINNDRELYLLLSIYIKYNFKNFSKVGTVWGWMGDKNRNISKCVI